MANITPVILNQPHDRISIIKWANITENDTPLSFKPRVAFIGHDKTFSVVGTFGGMSITLKGSLDPDDVAAYLTLHDAALADLTFTSLNIRAVHEAVFRFKPVISGGSGASVDVYVLIGGR